MLRKLLHYLPKITLHGSPRLRSDDLDRSAMGTAQEWNLMLTRWKENINKKQREFEKGRKCWRIVYSPTNNGLIYTKIVHKCLKINDQEKQISIHMYLFCSMQHKCALPGWRHACILKFKICVHMVFKFYFSKLKPYNRGR